MTNASQLHTNTALQGSQALVNHDIEISQYFVELLHNIMSWVQTSTFQEWAWVGALLHFAITMYLVVRILSSQRNTGVAIAWLVLLFAIPIVGIILYILIGEPFLGKSYQDRNSHAKHLLADMAEHSKIEFSKIDERLPKHYRGVSQIGTLDTGYGVYGDHTMQLLNTSDAIFDSIIIDINNAVSLILMEFYIVFPKGRVQEVFAALIDASARGVECQILADSVGSFSFFVDDWYDKLTESGVSIHQSLPVGLFKTLFKRSDLRNHRKIVVIDENIGYTGSFNLVDPQFFKQEKSVGKWIDIAMRITSAKSVSVVSALATVSITDISAESRNNLDALGKRINEHINAYTRKLYRSTPAINDLNDKASNYLAEHTLVSSISEDYGQEIQLKQPKRWEHVGALNYNEHKDIGVSHAIANKTTNQSKQLNNAFNQNDVNKNDVNQNDVNKNDVNQNDKLSFNTLNLSPVDNVIAQLIPSAPRLTEHVIYNTLLSVLHRANKHIQITTPYFVPDEALLSALTTAAKRGVKVTLIVPKKVDSFLVQHASQASYSILMEAGVHIALFKGGLLHAKTVVIDHDYCLFGTVNMDMRSFYLNMEVSLALYSPDIVVQVIACQQTYLTQCEWLEQERWNRRANYRQLFDAGIRLFSPLL